MSKLKKHFILICSVGLMIVLVGISYNYENIIFNQDIVAVNSSSNEFIMTDIEVDSSNIQNDETDCSSLGFFDSIICKIKSIGNSIIDWIGKLIWAILRVIFYII